MLWRILLLAALATNAAFAIPAITQQPQPIAGRAGQPATFTVAATGTGNLSYQWRRDGFVIAGATNSSLTFANLSQGDNGNYDVLITDAQQSLVSAPGLLRVSPRLDPQLMVPVAAKSVAIERNDLGNLRDVVVLADGRFYVIGDLSSVAGRPSRGIARFLASGARDESFAPAAIDGEVQAMAVQSDSKVIIGGPFTTVGGVQSVGLARLEENGNRDASFAVGVGFAGTRSSFIQAIAVGADGAVFVSGAFFASYRGTSLREMSLLRLSPTAAFQQEYSPPQPFSSPPLSLLPMPDGKLLAGGSFHSGVTTTRIARFLPTGAEDPSFPALIVDNPVQLPVRLFRQADGRILVAGNFTRIGAVSRQSLARMSESGAIDLTFSPNLSSTTVVSSVAQLPEGDLIIGGNLQPLTRLTSSGTKVPAFAPPTYVDTDIVRALPNGTLVVAARLLNRTPSLIPITGAELIMATGARLNPLAEIRFPAEARVLRPVAGGKIIASGSFTHWDGVRVGRVVRLNADLSRDASFAPAPDITGEVASATLQPDGKIIILGNFDTMAGVPRASIARLHADGTLDLGFQATSAATTSSPPPVVLRDGKILNHASIRPPYFSLYNPDGSNASTTSFGSGTSGTGDLGFSALSLLPNGQLLIGGNFTRWNGEPRANLVRLESDGRIDPSFVTNGAQLRAIGAFDWVGNAVQSTGRAVVRTSQPGNLVRVNTDGSVDPSFIASLPRNASVAGYLIQPDDAIMAWGRGLATGSTVVARFRSNSVTDTSLVLDGSQPRVGEVPYSISAVTITDAGEILASAPGRFLVFAHATAPVIRAQPPSRAIPYGSNFLFIVEAVGSGALSYQWYRDGQPLAGQTATFFTLGNMTPEAAGDYYVVVSDSRGSTTSAISRVTLDTTPNRTMRLSNVSVRARVASQPMIVGFVVANGPRLMLARGIGPTLGQFGVAGALANPRLVIYRGDVATDQNDNWDGDELVAALARAVSAFPLPAFSLDAALVRDFQGAQTMHIDGAGGTGVGLAEIYDVENLSQSPARIANVSARHHVGVGEGILIAGFSLSGAGRKAMLVRGIGPTLAQFGVNGAVSAPQLELYSSGAVVAVNSGWGSASALSEAFVSVGAFPLPAGSRDAALLAYLSAGSYTAQLSGVGGTTGEGLIEIYELP